MSAAPPRSRWSALPHEWLRNLISLLTPRDRLSLFRTCRDLQQQVSWGNVTRMVVRLAQSRVRIDNVLPQVLKHAIGVGMTLCFRGSMMSLSSTWQHSLLTTACALQQAATSTHADLHLTVHPHHITRDAVMAGKVHSSSAMAANEAPDLPKLFSSALNLSPLRFTAIKTLTLQV
jgi:hypothetical protein